MRIIAGDYKGRRLKAPLNKDIRPTADKVKEAVFSILNSHMELSGSRVCDLFAGTGSLGLEALSRGAEHCCFGDSSKESIKLLRENISYCGAEDRSTVLAGDFRNVLGRVSAPCDLFFLDPPYKEGLLPDCFAQIGKMKLLSDGGLIVAEHRREEVLPEKIADFVKMKERKYGTVVISIYG